MYGVLIVVHLLIAILLVGLVLLQQGKGAQTGAAFGSGASTTLFGSQGSGHFLSRATAMLAAAFFVVNLALGYLINRANHWDTRQSLKPLQLQEQLPADANVVPRAVESSDLPAL